MGSGVPWGSLRSLEIAPDRKLPGALATEMKVNRVWPREPLATAASIYIPYYKKRPGGRLGELVYPLFL